MVSGVFYSYVYSDFSIFYGRKREWERDFEHLNAKQFVLWESLIAKSIMMCLVYIGANTI